MSRLAKLFSGASLALLVSGLPGLEPRCLAEARTGDRIPLRILYAGHPGSEGEADFVVFLKEHFRQVTTGHLAKANAQQAANADVVLFDYDGDGFKAPWPRLGADYARATVTIGVAGARFSGQQGLKTGYM